jgi:hypothetical protein
MPQFRRFNVGNNPYVHYNTLVNDRTAGKLVFASIVGYATAINQTVKDINKMNSVYIEGHGQCGTVFNGYIVEKRKQPNSEFMHAVIYRKDAVEQDEQNSQDEVLKAYIYSRNDEEKLSRIYDKLYKHTSVPVLMEWMPYVLTRLQVLGYLKSNSVLFDNTDGQTQPFECYFLNIKKSQLIRIVSDGLSTGAINIRNSNTVSETMREITGLDSYLTRFGETLAAKIQQSFIPKFIPGESIYDQRTEDYDDACFDGGIEIFEAQKAVMQASVNNLRTSDISFIIGEMGSGKTLLGAGVPYVHHGKNGYVCMVMAPSHLTNKWKREVERLVPNGKGYIIKNLEQLLALDSKIRNPKNENMYIIISKESAKFGYEYKPAVKWSRSKRGFVCPECGQRLMKKIFVGTGRQKESILVPLEKRDFVKQYAYNVVCENHTRKWDGDSGAWTEETVCGTKLWSPLNNQDLMNTGWLKLGSEGWIMTQHVDDIFGELISQETISRRDATFLAKLSEKRLELLHSDSDDVRSTSRAPRKYQVAKYIREHYKGLIDYFIADELHLYKGDTEQGQAFGDIALASKKIIGLTGTLLNGYADGLFYILYRTLPALMRREGFDFHDESDFMRSFGVIRRTNRFALSTSGRAGQRIGSGSEKRLPGVSPLVFTKFLLENAVFLSLSDMAEGLPPYEEIPMAIRMDDQLAEAYRGLEQELRSVTSMRGSGGVKAMGALLQTLSVYPDMPYDQPPIIHPDSGETLVVPQELPRGTRDKEAALLNLIQQKREAGEKVLVYYHWTNRTDLADKLTNMLVENGISSAVLESRVTPDRREEWIDNQLAAGIDVMICNPTLVETGLDLLAFTTIVFYQVGYNIFTMRQASRRSWRLSQENAIQVYFMYYEGTIQEQALSLMATKLQASMAIEGRFSEEGLRAMSNNEDLLTQIANSVVNGIRHTVEAEVFKSTTKVGTSQRIRRERKRKRDLEAIKIAPYTHYSTSSKKTLQSNSTGDFLSALFSNKQHIGNLY